MVYECDVSSHYKVKYPHLRKEDPTHYVMKETYLDAQLIDAHLLQLTYIISI